MILNLAQLRLELRSYHNSSGTGSYCSQGVVSFSSRGFTVVELVASIVLVAIISATVSTRWFGTDTFQVSTASSQFLTIARLAQRIAQANSSITIHLRIDQAAGDWQYLVNEDDAGVVTTLHRLEIDAADINIQVTAGIGPSGLSAATSLDLEYDSLGNLKEVTIGANPGVVTSGVAIDLSATGAGTANRKVCISPLGFAHDGICV